MARRLKAIADWINEHLGDSGYRAEIVSGYCCTDTYIRSGRIRVPGKGRRGNRLLVFLKSQEEPSSCLNQDMYFPYVRPGEFVMLDHNAAQTYRCNQEVEDWLERSLCEMGKEWKDADPA